MKKISSRAIKSTLDKWVSGVGTGRYQPNNHVDNNNFSMRENFGIQQVKTEIYKFIMKPVHVLCKFEYSIFLMFNCYGFFEHHSPQKMGTTIRT